MVNNHPPEKPEVYKGLHLCENIHCRAQYKPSKHWWQGNYETGTTGVFVPRKRVPLNHCPVCGKKQENNDVA